MEIDRDIISFHWFKKGCCQLQAKLCAQSTVNHLVKLAQEKMWLGENDCLNMTIAVD